MSAKNASDFEETSGTANLPVPTDTMNNESKFFEFINVLIFYLRLRWGVRAAWRGRRALSAA